MSYGPYSYSRLATFLKCPAKFKYAYIDKLEAPYISSPAAERGTEIHKTLEDFMNKHTEMLHPDIHQHYGQFFFSIRENYTVQPEAKWAFNWELKPCDYDSSDCMVRGFMDLKFVPSDDNIQVFEYKTGSIYPEHLHQQWLYGVAGLLQHCDKSGVDVTAIYLDQRRNRKIYYPASMLVEYKPALMREIQTIENTAMEDFIPKPHFGCKWCPFSTHNGGPCQF